MRWARRATLAGAGVAVLGGCAGSGPPTALGVVAQPATGAATKAAAAGPAPAQRACPEPEACAWVGAAVVALPAAARARLDAASAPLALAVADGPLLLHAGE